VRFKVGDYVMLKNNPIFVWQVKHVKTKDQIYASKGRQGIMPIGDRLTMSVVCNLEGKLVGSPFDADVKQQAWDVDLEEAPAMLVIAWVSQ